MHLLYLGSEMDVTAPINQLLDHVRVKPFPRRGEDRRLSILRERVSGELGTFVS